MYKSIVIPVQSTSMATKATLDAELEKISKDDMVVVQMAISKYIICIIYKEGGLLS